MVEENRRINKTNLTNQIVVLTKYLTSDFLCFRFLALVCILREENFDKRGLIDYNFLCFRHAIQEVSN